MPVLLNIMNSTDEALSIQVRPRGSAFSCPCMHSNSCALRSNIALKYT